MGDVNQMERPDCKVLSIHEDYVNADERYIWQAFYGGWDYQHWKFTQTSRGTYVIRLQSAEPYATDWCMSAGNGVLIGNGRNVEQQEYTNDSDYKDEWILRRNEVFFWDANEDEVFYWQETPRVYIEDLTTNDIFYFQQGVDSALEQWGEVLSMDFETTVSPRSADIVCYGGTYAELSQKNITMGAGSTGITDFEDMEIIDTYTIYCDGSPKHICVIEGKISIGIASVGHLEDAQKNVVVHEFGHALGYHGHSAHRDHVMHWQDGSHFILTTEDKRFLQQIYLDWNFNY